MSNPKTSSGKEKDAAAGNVARQASSKAVSADAPRIIKKYPNRRLYDTNTSAYITMAEVRKLVMERQHLIVRDAKTNEDLTRSILLQIILEEEAGGMPMFTEAVLANIIRFYGHSMQGMMGAYIEHNMQTMMEMQNKLAEQMNGKVSGHGSPLTPDMWAQLMNIQNPMMQSKMVDYAQKSKDVFSQMQEQMQKQAVQMMGAFGIKP